MGFALSIIYIVLAILSPAALFGEVAATYHIQIIIAVLALLVSMPGAINRQIWRIPQSALLFAMTVAVGASLAANHWLGGAALAMQAFISNSIVFYLLVINCLSLARLKLTIAILAVICCWFAVQGVIALQTPNTLSDTTYVLVQHTRSGDLLRIRGVGFLNDPNDLAQLFVSVIPLMFVWWKPQSLFRNIALVILPDTLLLVGILLTHSRGATLAFAAVLALFFRKKVGRVMSVGIGGSLVALMMALNFSGGRDVSMDAGSDRIELWSNGLQAIKHSPLFGIGYGQFAENYGLTAHNSFIVTAAELGVFGYIWWIALLVFTFDSLNHTYTAASQPRVAGPVEPVQRSSQWDNRWSHSFETELHASSNAPSSEISPDDAVKWAEIMRIALSGFLVAGFFLSRSYVMTLYVLLGMGTVVGQLHTGQDAEGIRHRTPGRLLTASGGIVLASIIMFYVFMRFRSLVH